MSVWTAPIFLIGIEEGLKMRSLRPIEVGLEKVKLEWGLHCIAHNMRKLAAINKVAAF